MNKTKKAPKTCIYARIATGGVRETIEMQKADLMAYLLRNNLEYAGSYFDAGVSGRNINKRFGFQQMIADCRAGKINKIVCKSMSRFSRNSIHTYMTIRELRELGVSVYFIAESIDTLTPAGNALIELLEGIDKEQKKLKSKKIIEGLQIRKRFAQ